ncbi:MAG: hypothetical protein ACK4TG_06490, partial [Thermaurantiacus sp.]
MHREFRIALALALATFAAPSAPVEASTAPALSWTDLADLSIASPIILRADVTRVRPLGRRDAPDVPPGEVRALVEASLVNVLKAPDAVPGTARWLWQGPAGQRG